MTVVEKGFFTILGVSLVLILVAIPLALRKVAPNVVYGYRTRATLANEAVWYEANAYFGKRLIVACLFGAAVGMGSLRRRGPSRRTCSCPCLSSCWPLRASLRSFATSRFVGTLTPPR